MKPNRQQIESRNSQARQESWKRRHVTASSVGSRDLCGSKTGLFPLIRGSSCTPAYRLPCTLNNSDIYADKKTQHFSAASDYFHSKSHAISLSLLHCHTITGTQGVCGVRLSTLLTSSVSLSLSVFPLLPICVALPRLPAFEEKWLSTSLAFSSYVWLWVCTLGSFSGFPLAY